MSCANCFLFVQALSFLNGELSCSLFAWRVDDRRAIHHEQENKKRRLIVFEVGDVAMVRSEVQSKNDKKTSVTHGFNPPLQVYQPQIYGFHQEQLVAPQIYGLHIR